MYRKSFAASSSSFQQQISNPEKPAQSQYNNRLTINTQRNGQATARSNRLTVSSSSHSLDLRQYETKMLQHGLTLVPQFLSSTRYQGVIPQPFSPKHLRKDESINIFLHIIRQIDPAFKYTNPNAWEVDLEWIAKSYGYPFSIASKSSMSSFDVSEASRRCVLTVMTWLIQYILYFQDVYGLEGKYAYDNVISTIESTTGSAINNNDNLDHMTTFLLIRSGYHEWLTTGNNERIAYELVSNIKQQHKILQQTITTQQTQYEDMIKNVEQFNNINTEMQSLRDDIARLEREIDEEDAIIDDYTTKLQLIEKKTNDKNQQLKIKQDEVSKSKQIISSINDILKQQSYTEEDINEMNKNKLLLKDEYDKLAKTLLFEEETITTLSNQQLQQLQHIQKLIDTVNDLKIQQNENISTCSILSPISSTMLNKEEDIEITNEYKLTPAKHKLLTFPLPALKSLSSQDIENYVIPFSKNLSISSCFLNTPIDDKHINTTTPEGDDDTTYISLNTFPYEPDGGNNSNEYDSSNTTNHGITNNNKKNIPPAIISLLQNVKIPPGIPDNMLKNIMKIKKYSIPSLISINNIPDLFVECSPNDLNSLHKQYSLYQRQISDELLALSAQSTHLQREKTSITQQHSALDTSIKTTQLNIDQIGEKKLSLYASYKQKSQAHDNNIQSLQQQINQLILSKQNCQIKKDEYNTLKYENDLQIEKFQLVEQQHSVILQNLCQNITKHLNQTQNTIEQVNNHALSAKQYVLQDSNIVNNKNVLPQKITQTQYPMSTRKYRPSSPSATTQILQTNPHYTKSHNNYGRSNNTYHRHTLYDNIPQ